MLGDKPESVKSRYRSRTGHYMVYLRVPSAIHERAILTNNPLAIVEFGPKASRNFSTFVTNGMSEIPQYGNQDSIIRTELILYAAQQAAWTHELLTKLAACPFEYQTNFTDGDTLS